MRGGVGFGPREAEAERVLLRTGSTAASSWSARLAVQLRFAERQPGRVARLAQRAHEVEVREAADVVQVQRIARAGVRDVRGRPLRRALR